MQVVGTLLLEAFITLPGLLSIHTPNCRVAIHTNEINKILSCTGTLTRMSRQG